MKAKTLWITRTAALLALLIVVQTVTKNLGQIVTGSCVNAVLALATLTAGFWSGLTVAVVSPFLAFSLGIGPQLIAVVPAIAAGNATLVKLLAVLSQNTSTAKTPHWLTQLSRSTPPLRQAVRWLVPSAGKFLILYLLVVQVMCRVLTLNEKQIALFSAMFSWPQLITALIGSGIALLAEPLLKKALKQR